MNILIIDDEKSIRYSLEIGLKKLDDVNVYSAETGEKGLEIIQKTPIDLAIIDIKLPGIDGLEVLERINKLKLNTTIIMITYISEVRIAVKAMKMGAYDYFTKPFKVVDVINSINNLRDFINKKNKINIHSNEILIGKSKNIQDIRNIISKIGEKNINTSVLITGESGTGKEVVAKNIGIAVGKDKPFVPLNCAAVPKTLQESELFGYEKGSFSEAKEKKIGLMERSNGGTLFLDEVGDMDLSLQKKLLRALQEKAFRRVGGSKEIPFNSMIIAATNKDLRYEIKYGNFREDLYFRLNVIPIKIKPLRNRKEDIDELLEYFMNFYKDKMDSSIKSISEEALNVMKEYDWYGNVRELKNTIERIMILSNNKKIEVSDLPEDVFLKKKSLKDNDLQEAEKQIIIDTLAKNDFNITHTSKELGITRTTLRNKMKKYEIESP
ncbi:MAG: sigma-54 dependent transcriptional regulator [Bacillota bacterium]|nr:sigma-54 dependent transcriptional regulator [Bacillota bacterium]